MELGREMRDRMENTVALEVGYLDEARYEALRSGAIELSSYLANQIKSLRSVG